MPRRTNATALNDEVHFRVPYHTAPESPGASSPMSVSATCRVIAVPKIDHTSTNQPSRASAPTIWLMVADGRNGTDASRSTSPAAIGNRSSRPSRPGITLRLGASRRPPGSPPEPEGSTSPSTVDCWPTPAAAITSATCSTPANCMRSARDQPAHVASAPSAANRITVGEKAAPAARNRSHHGNASLHWISCTILPAGDTSVVCTWGAGVGLAESDMSSSLTVRPRDSRTGSNSRAGQEYTQAGPIRPIRRSRARHPPAASAPGESSPRRASGRDR